MASSLVGVLGVLAILPSSAIANPFPPIFSTPDAPLSIPNSTFHPNCTAEPLPTSHTSLISYPYPSLAKSTFHTLSKAVADPEKPHDPYSDRLSHPDTITPYVTCNNKTKGAFTYQLDTEMDRLKATGLCVVKPHGFTCVACERQSGVWLYSLSTQHLLIEGTTIAYHAHTIREICGQTYPSDPLHRTNGRVSGLTTSVTNDDETAEEAGIYAVAVGKANCRVPAQADQGPWAGNSETFDYWGAGEQERRKSWVCKLPFVGILCNWMPRG